MSYGFSQKQHKPAINLQIRNRTLLGWTGSPVAISLNFFQVPEGFFAHSVAQFGSNIPSIRQVTRRSHHFTLLLHTKQFSCNGVSTGPVAETLHEQDIKVIESRESRIDIVLGTRKGRRPRNNWCHARASSCWESQILDYKQWRNSWEASKL